MIDSLEFQLGLTAAIFAHALIWAPLIVASSLLILEAIRENHFKGNRRRFSFRRFFLWDVSLKKVGGIRFFKCGRFGCSFWLKRKK